MKNLTQTIKYICKNLIFVLGFVVLPACFMGGLLKPFSTITFVVDYKNLVVSGFGDILKAIYGISWVAAFNWLLAIILFVVLISAVLGVVDNHFKTGKLNVSPTLNFINNNSLIVATYSLIFIASYVLYKFLLGLVCFILHIVFGCLNTVISLPAYIIFVIIFALSLLLVAYLFGMVLIAVVDTCTCGYSILTSMSDATDLIGKKVWQVILLVVLPFVIIVPLVIVGHLFGLSVVLNIISLIILYSYYPVLAYTMYYDFSRITRHDNIKRYYY